MPNTFSLGERVLVNLFGKETPGRFLGPGQPGTGNCVVEVQGRTIEIHSVFVKMRYQIDAQTRLALDMQMLYSNRLHARKIEERRRNYYR